MSKDAPFFIAVAGGSASGKKDVCNYIMDRLHLKDTKLARKVAMVSLSDFHRTLTAEETQLAKEGECNFDHPDAYDWELLESFLEDVCQCREAQIPIFDNQTKTRNGFKPFLHADIVLLEGTLVLYQRAIYGKMSMMLFVDVDPDVRLSRTVSRDLLSNDNKQPTKNIDAVLNQWIKFVKPAFEDFISPCKKVADLIIPRGPENTTALNMLTQHINDLITMRGTMDIRSPTIPGRKLSLATTIGQQLQTLNLEEKSTGTLKLHIPSTAIDLHRERSLAYASTPN